MRSGRTWLVALGLAVGVQLAPPSAYAWVDWPSEWNPGRPSSAGAALREPVAGRAPLAERAIAAAPPLIDAPMFRLEVPHRTQKDGGRWQISNCGPATLGMILDGFGIGDQATDDLRFRAHVYQGTVGARTGTALEHIAHVAEDFEIKTVGLYREDGRFQNWSVEEIRSQLRLGRPVMPLVRLYLLPGREGVGVRWGHYILLTGLTHDGFFYSDSLQTDPALGTLGTISAAQLEQAMQASHIPGQAVAFDGPALSPLKVWTPES